MPTDLSRIATDKKNLIFSFLGNGVVHNYAAHATTLPHNSHMMSHHLSGNGGVSGIVTSGGGGVTSTAGGIDIDDMPPPPRGGGGGGTLWSQSYRDVRDVMALSHSRENTLSRDNHLHSVIRELEQTLS